MRKPFKEKNHKALVIHPLNEMTEFVHEQRNFVLRILRLMYIKHFQNKGIPSRITAAILLMMPCGMWTTTDSVAASCC